MEFIDFVRQTRTGHLPSNSIVIRHDVLLGGVQICFDTFRPIKKKISKKRLLNIKKQKSSELYNYAKSKGLLKFKPVKLPALSGFENTTL